MSARHLARVGPLSSAGGYTPPAAPDYVSEVVADGPLGLWLLNETSGSTAVDSSGNGNNGTYSGGITLAQTGPFVDTVAAAFASDQVTLPTDLSGGKQVTLEMWLYFPALSHDDKVLAELSVDSNTHDAFLLNPMSSATNPKAEVSWHASTYASVEYTQPTAATWHHLSVTINNALRPSTGACTVMLDGVLVTVTPTSGLDNLENTNWGSDDLCLGARDGVVAPLNCSLWGVAVFDTILSDSRRLAHANAIYHP